MGLEHEVMRLEPVLDWFRRPLKIPVRDRCLTAVKNMLPARVQPTAAVDRNERQSVVGSKLQLPRVRVR